MMHDFLCSAADIHDKGREMTLPAHRVLPVILVSSAVFVLCVCQGTQIREIAMLIMQIVTDQGLILNGAPASYLSLCSLAFYYSASFQ